MVKTGVEMEWYQPFENWIQIVSGLLQFEYRTCPVLEWSICVLKPNGPVFEWLKQDG
jgi:hypothetical protein